MDCIEYAMKHKELAPGEKSVSCHHISDTEFTNEVTLTEGSPLGSLFLLRYELDKQALQWKAALVVDGTEKLTYSCRILSGPLRLECWVVLADGDRVSAPAVSALEELIVAAVRRIREQ